MMEGTRLKLKRDLPYPWEAKTGDMGVCTKGSEYEPGWDAGIWSVKLDNPGNGMPSCNYWTRNEMLDTWEVINVDDAGNHVDAGRD